MVGVDGRERRMLWVEERKTLGGGVALEKRRWKSFIRLSRAKYWKPSISKAWQFQFGGCFPKGDSVEGEAEAERNQDFRKDLHKKKENKQHYLKTMSRWHVFMTWIPHVWPNFHSGSPHIHCNGYVCHCSSHRRRCQHTVEPHHIVGKKDWGQKRMKKYRRLGQISPLKTFIKVNCVSVLGMLEVSC